MPKTSKKAGADEALPSFRRSGSAAIVMTQKGERRRTTVYLDLSVARRLATYCAASDTNMSDAVNRAVERMLDEEKA